jgi:hypothetical protein
MLSTKTIQEPACTRLRHASIAHLLREGGRWGHAERVEQGLGGGHAGLVHEHAGVEVERRRGAELGGRPRDLVGALLAVADLVLRGVAPRLLAEAVHHRVEVALLELEQLVDVLEHLDVRVQVHHPLVLHELRHEEEPGDMLVMSTALSKN